MIKETFIQNRQKATGSNKLTFSGYVPAYKTTLCAPKDCPEKLVFLEHGLGARKEYPHMFVLEKFFVENGYNVVNLDACNSNNASDKSEEGITFSGHYHDLEDVIVWANPTNQLL